MNRAARRMNRQMARGRRPTNSRRGCLGWLLGLVIVMVAAVAKVVLP